MKIFISYRRQESAYIAAVISEKLQNHFGPEAVFLDVDNVPLGVDFRDYLGNAVGQCDVLLALMGDKWADIRDDHGERRLDKPTDHVRVEIESALKRNIPVVPVLVDQATMPDASALPESLQPLIFRNAAELRAGRDLRQHLERLLAGLESLARITSGEAAPSPPIAGHTNAGAIVPVNHELRGENDFPTSPPMRASAGGKRIHEREALACLKNCLGSFTDSHLFTGSIPPTKLEAALKSYGFNASAADVLLLYDNTVWGGAKDGFLLTPTAVHWHNMWESGPRRLPYDEIKTIEVQCILWTTKVLVNLLEIELNMGKPKLVAAKLVEILQALSGC